MKTLLILRHAKSDWGSWSTPDHDRPLNKRGKRVAPQMGQFLRRQIGTPDLIVSSTALRACTTAQLVADEADYAGEVVLTRDFYHAGPSDYIEYLQVHEPAADVVLVVGHNPGMEILVEHLTDAREVMQTACLAHVTLPIASWADFSELTEGKLEGFYRPKELGIL